MSMKVWDTFTYDFGNVAVNSSVTHAFAFTVGSIPQTLGAWAVTNLDGVLPVDVFYKAVVTNVDEVTVTLVNVQQVGTATVGEQTFMIVAQIEE